MTRACTLVLLATALWATAAEDLVQTARQLVGDTGIQGGLVVHVGCGTGELSAALRLNDRYLVQGLDRDAAVVATARQRLRSRGLYGPVSVDEFDGSHLPYTDNLVNLLISAAGLEQGNAGPATPDGLERAEIRRVLAPGGVAVFRDVQGAVVETFRKPWPEEIDSWSHYLHGADNNAVAADTRVGPPKHLIWKAGPRWCRSHELTPSINCVVTDQGRLFVVQDEGVIGQPRGVPARWRLVARDAFNGLLLWKRTLARGDKLQHLVVAAGDRLLAPLGAGRPISILDAATGDDLAQLPETESAVQLIVCGDIAAVGGTDAKGGRRGGGGSWLAAFDARTGQARWRRPAAGIRAEAVAAADGRIYYHDGKALVAVAMADGGELWRARCQTGKHLIVSGRTVLVSAGGGLKGFDATDGRLLWSGPRTGLDLFVAQGLVWVDTTHSPGRNVAWTTTPYANVGLDLRTGKEVRRITVENLLSPGHHPRCYRAKATEKYILQRKRGIEFVDLTGDDHMRHDWLRGPCRHGFVPANGLVYLPPHPCFCYPGAKLNGFNAVGAQLSSEADRPLADEQRLTRGPAFGQTDKQPASPAVAADDWLTFRHDARRSGCTPMELPGKLTQVWTAALETEITPPVVADDDVFVAAKEAHTVICLEAATGAPKWEYPAAGRIDSPPTVWGGLVLFGSRSGHVYCLRRTDGVLVWRFLAAPSPRRIMAFGQLESPWPVHGSVLLEHDLAYVTAGRSSHLDGGIYAYALRPTTGDIVYRTVIHTPNPDIKTDAGRPFDVEGTRNDVLVSDGTDIYVLRDRLAPDLARRATPPLTRMGDHECGLHLMATDGLLDDTWFNRSFWTYSRHWPGFYFGYRASKSGQLLVFSDELVCAVKAFTERHGHSPEYAIGSGYQLVADRVDNEPFLNPHAIGRDKSEGFTRSAPPVWSERVATRAIAMVLAGHRLCIAGPPDAAPDDDPMAAFDGRLGGELRIFSVADGEQLAELKLDQVPVSDGMIAAQGRLYVATRNGQVHCFGAAQ